MNKKAACKAQLRSRMRRARSPRLKGKALGAYQKCISRRRGWRSPGYARTYKKKKGWGGGAGWSEDIRGRRSRWRGLGSAKGKHWISGPFIKGKTSEDIRGRRRRSARGRKKKFRLGGGFQTFVLKRRR